MKHIVLLLSAALLVSCQSTLPDYQAGSAAEAKAYVKRAVETGVAPKSTEAELIADKSAGKPQEGKWDAQKIERYISRYIEENPRVVAINRAANRGQITEKVRQLMIAEVEAQKEREAEERAAALQYSSSALNQTATQINQGSSYRMNSALMQNPSTSSPYGGGYGAGLSNGAPY
ncbi:hypothetical protein [Prosthecobacter vanneervenii]|uniref:Lipoprotein n=1 Tax=Prosthecobacter vanneervenii TaxID=48466 RepID=A0A7W7Y6V4_9BACT|nr:hypothetical protein [Prosthecobacter vanneervenii]MBB5030689.1 hypothetical protein [Prosthecobacter vanneervenii]